MAECAILGSIGRKRVSFALSNDHGDLAVDTIRTYDTGATSGVSATLLRFQRDVGLATLPERAGIAVGGLVRGDAISVTNTRWFLSRSGLRAMLGKPPFILNDFAATAWAIFDEKLRLCETYGDRGAPAPLQPGCYLVVGITSGFGVAAISRDEAGAISVLPTEAGHAAFAIVTDQFARLVPELFPGRRSVAAEEIVSAPGLLTVYNHLSRRAGTTARARTPEEVTRSVATDAVAHTACDLLAKAFWAQVGDLVMTFGAWDGVLVTGALANAIGPFLRLSEAQALFSVSARYHRLLDGVPRVRVAVENSKLSGMAQALRHC